MKKVNVKSRRGITLVALVVTIIILIILAAISINLILGENGILQKARDGRNNCQIATNEEQITLGNLGIQIEAQINDSNFSNEEVKIGDYVEYNIGYTDVYSGDEFTSITGWRIIDKGQQNSDGTRKNVKIVSTGVPAILCYNYGTSKGNKNDTPAGANDWWGTKEQVRELYGDTIADKGYTYKSDAETSGYPGYYAATGLFKNFASIPFAKKTADPDANQGTYTKLTVNGVEEIGEITGGKFIIESVAREVHNLTLEELNQAREMTEDNTNTSTQEKDGDTGLFYLRDLANETEFSTQYSENVYASYWLATADNMSRHSIYGVSPLGKFFGSSYTNGYVYGYYQNSYGVRPVVTLTSNIHKVSEGHWEIVESE